MLDGIFEKYWKTQAFKFTIDSKNWTITNEQNQEFEPTKKWDFTAWESLRFAIDILQQIRNSGPKNADWTPTRNDDFLHSPVRDGDWKNGKHFDSREFLDKENKGKKAELPSCGDANGAYNIARKGIMMFERIKTFPERPDLLIFDKDWDVYLWNDEYTLWDLLY
jgi:CRISPR-associated protein Cpf1